MSKTGNQEEGTEVEMVQRQGLKIFTGVNICRTKKCVGYSILMQNHNNKKMQMIWAAAEERETEALMEESNVIKLALLLAKEKGWRDVAIFGTNERLMTNLKSKDANDSRVATIIGNILYLGSLFSSCSFHHISNSS